MAKQGWLAIAICLFLASTLFYAGCSESSSSSDPVDSTPLTETTTKSEKKERKKDDTPKVNPLAPPPLLKDWNEPAVALLVSGEMHGYLEPCGCSLTQSGGLARRADLYRQMTEDRGWNVVGMDLGGTVDLKRASRTQSRMKFQTIINALNDINYQAMGVGIEELKLEESEPLFLLTQSNADPASPGVTMVSANLQYDPEQQLNFPLTHRVMSINGQKLFITSVLSESFWKELYPEGAKTDIQIQSPGEALKNLIPTLEEHKPDLAVLLSYAPVEESRKLAEQFPQFQVIVSTGTEEPLLKEETIGKTLLFTLGHKGKHVAVVGYSPNEPLKLEIIDLDKERFATAPIMIEHMRQYQSLIESQQLALNEPPIPHPTMPVATYVGAQKCGECHTQAFQKWSGTKHAHAYEALETGREGQQATWVSRVHDAECLACHVTGWSPQQALRYQGGFLSPEQTPHLMGQQCENCHGPGSEHVKLEELWKKNQMPELEAMLTAERDKVRLTKAQARKELCIKCHDFENDPNFKFDVYWPKVEHPWKY